MTEKIRLREEWYECECNQCFPSSPSLQAHMKAKNHFQGKRVIEVNTYRKGAKP